MNIAFDEANHVYTKSGIVVPNVTGIFKWAGLSQYDSVRADVLERACLFGKAVHRTCQLWDLKNLNIETLDPNLKKYLECWKIAVAQLDIVEWIAIEKIIYHARYNYVGMLDRVYRKRSGIVGLLDIKSGAVAKTTGMQTAGYMEAFQQETKIKITERLAVQLNDTNQPKIIPYKGAGDLGDFLACARVVQIRDEHGMKHDKKKSYNFELEYAA